MRGDFTGEPGSRMSEACGEPDATGESRPSLDPSRDDAPGEPWEWLDVSTKRPDLGGGGAMARVEVAFLSEVGEWGLPGAAVPPPPDESRNTRFGW